MPRLVWILTVAGMLTACGCENNVENRTPEKITAEDVRRDVGHAAHTAVEFSQQTKEEFQKDLEVRVKTLDSEIAKLAAKARDLQAPAKANWDRKMSEFQEKRDAACAKLAEISRSSADAWKDLQKGARSAWDEMDKAFEAASREF